MPSRGQLRDRMQSNATKDSSTLPAMNTVTWTSENAQQMLQLQERKNRLVSLQDTHIQTSGHFGGTWVFPKHECSLAVCPGASTDLPPTSAPCWRDQGCRKSPRSKEERESLVPTAPPCLLANGYHLVRTQTDFSVGQIR